MCKKKYFLFVLLLFCKIKTNAQPACIGKMLNAKAGRIETICFLRSPNPIGNITKYSLVLSGIEIYEVEFTYYKEGDSISVQFYDKQNSNVKREWIRLKSEDSHFLICDFRPNFKPIVNAEKYQILFGIDNPDQQFITLYQFQAIGGAQTQFILQDVPDAILSQHMIAVNDKEGIDEIRRKHALAIVQLKSDMIFRKDSIIKSITEKENVIISKEATLIADKALQEDFTKKMDNIFLSYFRNVHSFNNDAFDVTFSFSCDGNGVIKVDSIKSLYFRGGPQRNWLRDSFITKIKPQIERARYKTLTETNTYQNIKPDFTSWFENRFSNYSNLGLPDRDSFTVMQENINNELDAYVTRTNNLPTLYSYTFKYNSSVKKPTWKYVKQNDGNDKFIDKSDEENKVEISENLKQIFKSKYSFLGSGKYDLKVSTIYINNDAFKGQDIQLISDK